MNRRYLLLFCFSLFLLTSAAALATEDWPPIPPEDLKMTSFEKVPGAPAIVLTREVTSDDLNAAEMHYVRIKILTEEGKKFANVQTDEFWDQIARIENVQGRTIRPDGTITPFNGKVFDKLVAKYKQNSVSAKTFTLPDIQVGSIIEYRYTKRWERMYLFGADWTIDYPLFTRSAKFAFRRGGHYAQLSITSYSARNESEQPQQNADGWIRLEVNDVDPFVTERFMPPERELRWRVYIYYPETMLAQSIDEFWNDSAKAWSLGAEKYMDRRSDAQKAVARLSSSNETPLGRLQRLYSYVQTFKNLGYIQRTFDKSATKYKENEHVGDVLKNGYGYPTEINRTFVALARAGGFDATLVRVAERDRSFLHKELREFYRQLPGELAAVKVEGREIFLDPGTPYCGFGTLSWEDTDVEGLRLNNNGAVWTNIPALDAASALVQRSAKLSMDDEGSLSGELQVRLDGQEALWRRTAYRNDDLAKRIKVLTDEFKEWLAPGAEIQVTNVADWDTPGPILVTASIKFPSFATRAGKRLLLPANIFSGSDAQPFSASKRVHPIYFSYPYRHHDEMVISFPAGWRTDSGPNDREVKENFGAFRSSVVLEKSTVRIGRELTISRNSLGERNYPAIRNFFSQVQAGTDEQVVLIHAE